eukprot:augustus_masked-scaffold_2-processed-gene-3.39-mRNA-1 protein AED:1.00 eAED:1.00 QI:0/0/0/0/1/1/2/0/213
MKEQAVIANAAPAATGGVNTIWIGAALGTVAVAAVTTAAVVLSPQREVVTQIENEPKYTGLEGIAEFEKLTGEDETFIPIQGVRISRDTSFDVAIGDGVGSIDSHIDKETFKDALMTFSLDIGGGEPPLTAMSLSMLRDIGYALDTSGADEYMLPDTTLSTTSTLRGNLKESIDLSNDVIRITPVVLNPDDGASMHLLRSRKKLTSKEALGIA